MKTLLEKASTLNLSPTQLIAYIYQNAGLTPPLKPADLKKANQALKAKSLLLPNRTVLTGKGEEGIAKAQEPATNRLRSDECAGCLGLPCKKAQNKCLVAVRGGNGRAIGWRRCKYAAGAEIANRYRGHYDKDERNAAAIEGARSLIKGEVKGLYLHGGIGVGKTMLAVQTGKALSELGKKICFRRTTDLLAELIEAIRGNGLRSEQAVIKEVSVCEVLILDDIGSEKATQYAGAVLQKVIDARYLNERVTILTSNYGLEELAQRFDNAVDGKNLNGSRMSDRLREMCKVARIGGTSRR